MKLGLLFWCNIVVSVILISVGSGLLLSNKREEKPAKSVGGYICLVSGFMGVLWHLIRLLIKLFF